MGGFLLNLGVKLLNRSLIKRWK